MPVNSCIKHSQLAVSGQYRAAEAAPQTSKFAVRGVVHPTPLCGQHGGAGNRMVLSRRGDRSQAELRDRGNFEINNPLN